MSDLVEERYVQLLNVINEKNLNRALVLKAFEKANFLHRAQSRKDGSPYITHTMDVALILARLDYNSNIVAAALLHDTIEDCNYTKKQLVKDFNTEIFDLVDCVSAIDKTKYKLNVNNIYEDENFEKSSMEEQTFNKLIKIGRENPGGFAIKFADRLNNLQTISIFPYNKQIEKVKETERWIIPIAKILKSEYFYRALKNECFKIQHKDEVANYLKEFEYYHQINEKNAQNIANFCKQTFSNTISNIIISDAKEYKVFEDIKKQNKNISIKKISQSQIENVSNYNLYLLYKDNDKDSLTKFILSKFISSTNIRVIDARIGTFTNMALFVLEDTNHTKYNLYIMQIDKYHRLQSGMMGGEPMEIYCQESLNNLQQELIKVRTRSGEIKYLPQNSTALDFAFMLSKEIGLGFKYAIINNSKTKQPPFARLFENDKVEIVTEKNDKGTTLQNPEIKWLAYVNSELAKKILIKYFENKLK